MYRLLIVDDEPDIANGLEMYIKSNSHLELDIYTVYSAFSALEWLNRTKIDIVITDIRMPGMTGLQLIEEVYKNWPQCKVIFLTGHYEFEYIYSAIKYNDVSYVLKTESKEIIIDAIEKAIEKIEKSLKMEGIISESYEYMKTANILLQKDYFLDVLNGKIFDTEPRRKHLKELGIGFCVESPVLMLFGRVENSDVNLPSYEKTSLLYSIKLIAEKCFLPVFALVQLDIDKFNLLWLIQPFGLNEIPNFESDEKYWRRITAIMEGRAETFQSSCRESLDILLSIVYDSEPCTWDNMADRYNAMKWVYDYHTHSGIEMLMDRKALLNEINSLQNKEDVDRELLTVNYIKRYVNENIGGDLSVVKLAEMVHFNPQYLSRLFKKVTNTTMLSHINEVRLIKAKEMLENNDYRIHEIAKAVGFVSAAYFTQFFKKSMGIGPKEYRTSINDIK